MLSLLMKTHSGYFGFQLAKIQKRSVSKAIYTLFLHFISKRGRVRG